MENQTRILVGMSGGLDSTYTALYLKEKGYDVAGAILRMSAETDTQAAQEAADQVGVPLYIIDAEAPFETHVKAYFADAYANGETPNPCVMCNRYVKVAMLCDFAEEHGFSYVSTGHYAEIRQDADTGRYYVRMADQVRKDQSYVLWMLTQKQLSMLRTPLAHLNKDEIREAAAARGLHAAAAKESQDICFLPDGNYIGFVESRKGVFPEGDFVDPDGRVVGRHKGIIRYTVGQRKGLGIALGQPMFVTRIDGKTHTVHLAPAGQEYMRKIRVHALSFQKLLPEQLVPGLRAAVKIRYAAKPAPAVVRSFDGETLTVEFDEPQRAATPGQSAVFYDFGTASSVLFGGLIQS